MARFCRNCPEDESRKCLFSGHRYRLRYSTTAKRSTTTPLTKERAVFGFGKTKPAKGDSNSRTDRSTEQKDNEAVRSFLGSAKDESDRQAKRGEF